MNANQSRQSPRPNLRIVLAIVVIEALIKIEARPGMSLMIRVKGTMKLEGFRLKLAVMTMGVNSSIHGSARQWPRHVNSSSVFLAGGDFVAACRALGRVGAGGALSAKPHHYGPHVGLGHLPN